jgi:hypothetical protein
VRPANHARTVDDGARAIAANVQANRAYDAGHTRARPDRAAFVPVAARLAGVKLADIMAATGMSNTSASMVRAGRTVPHPRHWDALRSLGARESDM